MFQVETLEKEKHVTQRKKIDIMNADVNDENPYSRLMALKRMGIVEVFFKSFL